MALTVSAKGEDSWLCYVGVPKRAFRGDQGEECAPWAGNVFLVFVNDERVVYNRRWERALMESDEDRFVIAERAAASACRQAVSTEEWKWKFLLFVDYVRSWCKDRPAEFSACYLKFGHGCLEIVLATRGADYRFDLQDMVTALDLDLALRFEECPADVFTSPDSPAEVINSFLTPSSAIQVYPV